jgi:uncharacterized membrane protein
MKKFVICAVALSIPLVLACGPRPTASGTGGSSGRGGGGGTAGKGGAGGTGGTTTGDFPCDVAAVLRAKCQTCHGATPPPGAPRLLTYADTQARGVLSEMRSHVNSTTNPMPPASAPPLTAQEKATLNAWFTAGGPAGTAPCP